MFYRLWNCLSPTSSTENGVHPSIRPRDPIVYGFFRNRPGAGLWLLSGIFVVGIISLFVVELHSRYVSAIGDAERAAQSYTDILAEHTSRTFEAIERTLLVAKSIRSDLNKGLISPGAAHLALQNLQRSSPALLALGWTDADGDVIQSSYDDRPARQNISDLDHFKVQRTGLGEGLHIGQLFRSNQSGKWISAVSIRLEQDDGTFAGVVSAPLDLSYFARTYKAVQLGSNDSVSLARADGQLLTREPFVENAVGQSYKGTELFRVLLPLANSGTFASRSPIDQVPRIFAYRVVPGLPLITIVASDRNAVLAPWYEHIRDLAFMFALLIVAIFSATHLLWRRTRELAVQTSLLEATLDNMHEGLIVVDRQDRVAICNVRAMEMLGLPESLMTSRPSSTEVIAYQTQQGEFTDTDEEIRAVIHPRLHGEISHVYQRTRPNGTVLEVQTVPFANGGSIRTYKDITFQKQTEKELMEGEARYRLLADNTTDIIARLNFAGQLLYISPSSSSMVGYHPTELTGTVVMDFIHPDDVSRVLAFFQRTVNGTAHGRETIEYRFLHKREHWIWLEASPTVVFDDDGHAIELVDVVRNISKRKVAEAEAALLHQRAEQATAAKGQFLATMSHELRTPLNSIIGFADIVIDRTDLAPDARRQIELIQTASDTLLAVVNDILDFSQIEEGKMTLDAIAFDVGTLIEDSLSIVRGAARTKRLSLLNACHDTASVPLIGDARRLRQILLNLLNNAIKFTAHGSITLSVTCQDANAGIKNLRFEVIDTGIGIASDHIASLFERFTQVDGAINRDFGGSGLGLAISKRLVEAMGGNIGVQSEPDVGSTFWFELALPVAEHNIMEPIKAFSPAVQSGSARILLVEDVEVNREIAAFALRSLGYSVDIAIDGEQAIAAVKASLYDAVLMDIQMPGMDGIATTQIIRSLESPRNAVPVIAMTANVLPSQIEAFRIAGMNDHIGKPFKRNQLGATIERCLRGELSEPASDAKVIELSFDPAATGTLRMLLGVAKVDDLLGKLREQLRDFVRALDAPVLDHGTLGRHAHKMVASAGMLGFLSISAHCSRFEIALSSGIAKKDLIDYTRKLCVSALDAREMQDGRSSGSSIC